MTNRLKQIFKIMSFYDDFRWSSKDNYNLINFFRDGLDDDTKLLTHWLCYITDRQMSFKIIWDVGGFVISELIHNVKIKKTLTLLDPNCNDAFIEGQADKIGKKKYFLISKTEANEIIKNNYENYIRNKMVKFKSRFFPSDYFAILYTLTFLEEYEFKFSKFIKQIYHKNKSNTNEFVKRIMFSLYLMTYHNVGQPASEELAAFDRNLQKAKERKNEIKEILNDDTKFEEKYTQFKKVQIFKQKRAWCSLRDFLKSPEFKLYFKNALSEEGLVDDDFDELFSLQALTQLELPGDVWNNNSKFRKCILKNTKYENSNKSLNIILREFYQKNNSSIDGYPEQFDVTFDFVPRMCEQDNCNICPINKIDNEKNDFCKICLKDGSKFCTVSLLGCNYKNSCIPNKCKIA